MIDQLNFERTFEDLTNYISELMTRQNFFHPTKRYVSVRMSFLLYFETKCVRFVYFLKKRGPSFLVTTRGKKLLLLGNQSIYFWIEFPSRQKFRTGLKKRKLHLSLTGNFYVRSSFVTNKIISEFPLRD